MICCFFVFVSNTLAVLPFSCIEVGERKSFDLLEKHPQSTPKRQETTIPKVHFLEVLNIVFDTVRTALSFHRSMLNSTYYGCHSSFHQTRGSSLHKLSLRRV